MDISPPTTADFAHDAAQKAHDAAQKAHDAAQKAQYTNNDYAYYDSPFIDLIKRVTILENELEQVKKTLNLAFQIFDALGVQLVDTDGNEIKND